MMTDLIRPDPLRLESRRYHAVRSGKEPATVALTEQALAALVALRAAEHARPEQALGLVVGPDGGISLVLDQPGERDQVFSVDEAPILFVDADMGTRLAGRILDHAGRPGDERFTLVRPDGDASPPDRHLRRP